MIGQDKIMQAIEALGLGGREVCVHSSLRSFGDRIEGGPDALADSFLSRGCTLMVPSFTYEMQAAPVEPYMPERNGAGDYSWITVWDNSEIEVFSADSTAISEYDMGAFAGHIVRRGGRVRGNHPLNSFSALGPQAKRLVEGQNARDVYAPFRQLCEDGGYVLLMGVGLTNATIIHYAEQLAGRNLFIRWALNAQREVIPAAVGSCSDGFWQLDGVVSAIEKRIVVGKSVWRCFPAREMAELASRAIAANQQITHCGDPECGRCNDAVQGGPVIKFDF